jgi:sugar O-acyltransferase (sialic acid O-acetyltransferase NeuD family)
MKEKIVIYGAGSQGKIVADILRLRDEYQLIAFLDDTGQYNEQEIYGIPLIGGGEQLEGCFQKGINNLVVGIGDNRIRMQIAEKAIALGFSLATAIHPSVVIAEDVKVGAGTVIKALAVIEPGAAICENVILGAHSYIGHESVIGDGVHVSGGGRIGGKSQIGKGALIGIGAVLKDRIKIGEFAKVGAGSVVLEDVPDNHVVFGVPAKLLWERNIWQEK